MQEIPRDELDELNIHLLPGFQLMRKEEEGIFAYLFYRDKQVAIFPVAGLDPKKIKDAADRHLIFG